MRISDWSSDVCSSDLLDMTVMTMKSFFECVFSADDQVLSIICENILPQIYSQVNKLTVEQHSVERILLSTSYPKLYSISLVNFHEEILFQYLTGTILIVNFVLNIKIMKTIRFKLIFFSMFFAFEIIRFYMIF